MIWFTLFRKQIRQKNKEQEQDRKKEEYGENVVVLKSKAINVLLTAIRDKDADHIRFAHYGDRLLRILAEEALAHLPVTEEVKIMTPCGPHEGLRHPDYRSLCAVSIMRSGDILLEQVRFVAPGIHVGKILIQRDEAKADKPAVLYYSKLPKDIKDKFVILVDPMLGTGGSSMAAIQVLEKHGVKPENVLFLNVVSCPEGIRALHSVYPGVKLVTAAVDSHLNDDKYIVPGLGDFGDRYFGTQH